MKKGILFLTLVVIAIACSKKKTDEESEGISDNVSNIIESALSDVTASADNVDGSVSSMVADGFNLFGSEIRPLAACSIGTARSSCNTTALTRTVDWAECSITLSTGDATLDGTVTETYSGFGAASCTMTGNNSTVKRAISSSDPVILTLPSGAKITTDNEPGTAWDGTTFTTPEDGTSVIRYESGTSNGLSCAVGSGRCMRVVHNGLHRKLVGPRGTTWFEHILSSDVSFTGTKASGDRAMSGSATVWHEIAEYKAVNTFNTVTWGSSSCCYPTSGSISTVLTGTVSGNTTLTFTSTCGEATYVDKDGESSTLELTSCTN